MNREFELVQLLDREVSPPTHDEIARQHAALDAAIAGEITPRRRTSTRRVTRGVVRSLAATLVVVGLGGSAAFAWSQLSPDAKQAATVKRHYRDSLAVHRPGWRPELDAERVVCDYRGLGLATTSVYTWASDFPLAQPLTKDLLVSECRSGTDPTTGAPPITAPATLCAVTPPNEHLALPVVTFRSAGCDAPLVAAPATLLDERNRLRRAETAILAVPETCPSLAEAQKWTDQQVAKSGEHVRILPAESYPGGRCYLPYVHWGRGEVEILASQYPPTPGTVTPGTVPPPG